MLKQIDISKLSAKLLAVTESISGILPEMVLAGAILMLITISLFYKKGNRKLFAVLAVLSTITVLSLTLRQWNVLHIRTPFAMLTLDNLAVAIKLLMGLGVVLVVLLSYLNPENKERQGEYYALVLSLTMGAFFLVMSTNLLTIYLSIEIISISSYILTSFGFSRHSSEAALKYVLFGGVSSAIMIYGISLIYGLTGTLDITSAVFHEGLVQQSQGVLLVLSAVMVLSGFLFKVSSVPFHIWVPDVYTATPIPIAALFSTIPKAAGIIVLYRFVSSFGSSGLISNFDGHGIAWENLLSAIAILTMLVGNFSALWQNNAKRLLAYSSIAHSGFLMIGVVVLSPLALKGLLFYFVVYFIMNIAAFLLVQTLEKATGSADIKDYKGLGKEWPYLGTLVLVVMIALTGLPPTGGFTAKFILFSSLWEQYAQGGNHYLLILFLFGLVNTVIALFFYLKLPYFMFFKANENKGLNLKVTNKLDIFTATILVVFILVLFFKPEWLMDFFNNISFVT